MWKEYIRKTGIAETAGRLKVTRQTIYNWLDGSIRISDKMKLELIRMSGGFIKINDFFEGWEGSDAEVENVD